MNETMKAGFNTKEAVSYLGINRKLLDSYRKAGLIRAIKTGRIYIYPIQELNNFINQNIGNEITKDGLIYENC